PLNVGQFVQQIVNEFQAIHRDTHQVVFENHLSGISLADLRLLRQICANLISNAIKYSPQGGEVWICLDTYEGMHRLVVQDHGIGIPEADQQRLFVTFQRASNVGKISGTGLGLAIVKQAIDLQGGTMQLASEVERGTTVVVELPILAC